MNTTLKYFLISLPVLAGGYVIYRQVKKYKIPVQKPLPPVSSGISTSNGGSHTTQPPSSTTVAEGACRFPLKNGSYNNSCVGPLQDALGVTIDNDFGRNTEAALLARTGKTQIQSQAELSAVINQLNGITIDSRDQIYAKTAQLIGIYNANKTILKYVQMLVATSLKKVEHDPDNEEWRRLPYLIDLGQGQKLNVQDYVPVGYPDNATGNMVVQCTRGGNAGYWMLSPNDFVFV